MVVRESIFEEQKFEQKLENSQKYLRQENSGQKRWGMLKEYLEGHYD